MENIENQSPTPPNTFFTPLIISLLGIVSTTIAIIIYHFILVNYCLRRRQNSGRDSQTGPDVLSLTGVDEKVLKAIPIFAYKAKQGLDLDQMECTICLGELEEGEFIRLLPNCRHEFHVPCIDKWFMAHSNCPVCRSPIVSPVIPILPLHACVDETVRTELQTQNHGQEGNTNGDGNTSSSSRAQPNGLLRHCASMVIPRERTIPRVVMGLKRSLSMDYSHVIVEMERENIERASSSSSSSSYSSSKGDHRSNPARSLMQLDRVSSKLLRSFSRLRLGQSSTSGGILPY